MQQHVVRTLTIISVSAARMAEGKDAGGFHYDTCEGDNGPPAGGKRRLIREGGGGGGGCLSCQGSRSAPGPRWGSGIDCLPTTDDN